jgi:peptidase E
MTGQIVALGGWSDALIRWALSLAGVSRPRVLYVPTAIGDDDETIEEMLHLLAAADAEPDALRLFGIPASPLDQVEQADVVLVNGGNTANMLAVWRVHGVDVALRRAWERGAVLAGWSAGANCWFEGSVTDSFGAELRPLTDGLGLLRGSFCPHVDGEPERLPTFTRLVDAGALPAGLACDDAAGAWFVGPELRSVISPDATACAYRVSPGSLDRLAVELV